MFDQRDTVLQAREKYIERMSTDGLPKLYDYFIIPQKDFFCVLGRAIDHIGHKVQIPTLVVNSWQTEHRETLEQKSFHLLFDSYTLLMFPSVICVVIPEIHCSTVINLLTISSSTKSLEIFILTGAHIYINSYLHNVFLASRTIYIQKRNVFMFHVLAM